MTSGDQLRLVATLNSRRRGFQVGTERGKEVNRFLIDARCSFESPRDDSDQTPSPPVNVRPALQYLANLPYDLGGLTPAILFELYRILSHNSTVSPYRTIQRPRLFPAHEALPAEAIEGALDRLFDWMGSPGFGQLHPAGQMAVVQARILEIHPFPDRGLCLASVFSAFFPLSGGLLLPVPRRHSRKQWLAALEQALQFSTGALTQWNLEACLNAYDLAESGGF